MRINMRFLAIDYGLKRSGFAVCDSSETICSPIEVYEGQNGLISRVRKIVDEYQIQALLFGLPLNMDGTEGRQSQIVRSFAGEVKKAVSLEVFFQDERLSSHEAERLMIGADLTRKKKKKRLDAVAAAAILQAFLDNKEK